MIKGTIETKAGKPVSFPRLMQGALTGDIYLINRMSGGLYEGARIYSKDSVIAIGEGGRYINLIDFTGSITLQND